MSEYRLKISDFAPTGSVRPKISGRRGRLSPTILLLRKLVYRVNDLSYGIKNLERSFFLFVTIYAFDRRTDSFLVARPRCIQCMQCSKNVALANALQLEGRTTSRQLFT